MGENKCNFNVAWFLFMQIIRILPDLINYKFGDLALK